MKYPSLKHLFNLYSNNKLIPQTDELIAGNYIYEEEIYYDPNEEDRIYTKLNGSEERYSILDSNIEELWNLPVNIKDNSDLEDFFYSLNLELSFLRKKKVSLINIKYEDLLLYQSYKITDLYGIKELNFHNLSETLHFNEGFLNAAIRGLKEEINLEINERRLTDVNEYTKIENSKVKGIPTSYHIKEFNLTVNEKEMKVIPLTIHEKDGIVFLEWRKI